MMSLGATNAAVALPVGVPLPLQTTLQSSPLGPLLQVRLCTFLIRYCLLNAKRCTVSVGLQHSQ